MRVRAIAEGWDSKANCIRYPGDEFELPDHTNWDKSSWLIPLELEKIPPKVEETANAEADEAADPKKAKKTKADEDLV